MLEGPARGQRIPVRRESVVAFIGSSPRGPVGIPVAIHGLDEYQRRFGAAGYRGRMHDLLAQFFDNGGTRAVAVRVPVSERRHRLVVPGPAGDLVLCAVNPGPHECLRVSVDYDGIPPDDEERFNLVVHRLASRHKPIVEQQEIYRSVSIDPGDPDFFVHALSRSELVRPDGPAPMARPDVTRCPGASNTAPYQYSDEDWRENLSLTDYDLIGSNTKGTGIFALDRVPTVDIICLVPERGDLGPVALFAAERYCRNRHALLFVDPPSGWRTVADVVRERLSSVFASPNVVTYFPRPDGAQGGGINRAPSVLGALAGRLVAGDPEQGVWGSRDQLILRCRAKLGCILSEEDQAAVRRLGVNGLRDCAGGYLQACDLVTMDNSSGLDAEWSDLRLRRIGLFIVGSIARATRWAAFADANEQTWDDVRQQVSAFMHEVEAAGALHGGAEGGAWYVTRDRDMFGDTAAPREAVPGLASFILGFALSADGFMAFRFVQNRLDCKTQPVGWQPGVALAV